MYRTYVQEAIPERPFPRPEPIELGLEEFKAKPGLGRKKLEDLMDGKLLREVEAEGFFRGLYGGLK
jgi:hypothetical protein